MESVEKEDMGLALKSAKLEDRTIVTITDKGIVNPLNQSASNVVNEPATASNAVQMDKAFFYGLLMFYCGTISKVTFRHCHRVDHRLRFVRIEIKLLRYGMVEKSIKVSHDLPEDGRSFPSNGTNAFGNGPCGKKNLILMNHLYTYNSNIRSRCISTLSYLISFHPFI